MQKQIKTQNTQSDYTVLTDFLASGCSRGYLVYNEKLLCLSALKISMKNDRENYDKVFENELEILQKLKAEKISCIPAIRGIGFKQKLFTNQQDPPYSCYFIESEYGNYGDLLELLHQYCKSYKLQGLNENIAKFIFKQMIEIVYELHQNNIAHRDIKPHNFVLFDHMQLKIIDFGFATKMTEDGKVTGSKGTPSYMAPELHNTTINNNNTQCLFDGISADIYSLGKCLQQLLYGTLKQHNTTTNIHNSISQDAWDLLIGMTYDDPLLRISWDDILNHSWFNNLKYHYSNLEETFRLFYEQLNVIQEYKIDMFSCSNHLKSHIKTLATHHYSNHHLTCRKNNRSIFLQEFSDKDELTTNKKIKTL